MPARSYRKLLPHRHMRAGYEHLGLRLRRRLANRDAARRFIRLQRASRSRGSNHICDWSHQASSHRRLLLLRHARERDEHLGPRIMRGLFAQAAACRLTRESGARHPRLTALRNLQLRIITHQAATCAAHPLALVGQDGTPASGRAARERRKAALLEILGPVRASQQRRHDVLLSRGSHGTRGARRARNTCVGKMIPVESFFIQVTPATCRRRVGNPRGAWTLGNP